MRLLLLSEILDRQCFALILKIFPIESKLKNSEFCTRSTSIINAVNKCVKEHPTSDFAIIVHTVTHTNAC